SPPHARASFRRAAQWRREFVAVAMITRLLSAATPPDDNEEKKDLILQPSFANTIGPTALARAGLRVDHRLHANGAATPAPVSMCRGEPAGAGRSAIGAPAIQGELPRRQIVPVALDERRPTDVAIGALTC